MSAKRQQIEAHAGDVFVNPKLEDRRQLLARRIEDGYERIDQAAIAGNDVREWEEFWIKLLREYEQVCSDLKQAA